MYVSKDVRIRGNFSKPKGIRERKCLGSTAVVNHTQKHNHHLTLSVK
jgi:hypothetical protein